MTLIKDIYQNWSSISAILPGKNEKFLVTGFEAALGPKTGNDVERRTRQTFSG